MGIKMTNFKEFEKYLNEIRDKEFREYIIGKLSEFGGVFIREVRKNNSDMKDFKSTLNINGKDVELDWESPNYNNITTRLRNSSGYVISYNGKVEKSDFNSYSIVGEASEEGKQLGLEYATELARGLMGYALICVAAAPYARAVEAKGYNVITSGVLVLKQELLKKW